MPVNKLSYIHLNMVRSALFKLHVVCTMGSKSNRWTEMLEDLISLIHISIHTCIYMLPYEATCICIRIYRTLAYMYIHVYM